MITLHQVSKHYTTSSGQFDAVQSDHCWMFPRA
ncbi:hypothetical protein QOZ95_004001 [Paenibacillus brasilensis]|uniref:Uncharacterized protein n=1 Tax=Paenibacillus brasilensis TaxID=128574 RepID=A0ABU0L3E9_9BACL|nr:hypothetical protein [Paenibacillus brasilensis]